MSNLCRDSKKSKKDKIKSLEDGLGKIQQVLDSLLEQLGYKVTTSVYESEWESYEVAKVDNKKKDDRLNDS